MFLFFLSMSLQTSKVLLLLIIGQMLNFALEPIQEPRSTHYQELSKAFRVMFTWSVRGEDTLKRTGSEIRNRTK